MSELQSTLIILNDDDMEFADQMGRLRYGSSRKDGVGDQLESRGDPTEKDIMGAAGEIAACRFFGEDPHKWVKEGNYGSRFDLVSPKWGGIEVKTTGAPFERAALTFRNKDLDPRKHQPNDVFVLVIRDNFNTYFISGWMSVSNAQAYARFHPESKYENERSGGGVRVPAKHLNVMHSLPQRNDTKTRF